jgi:hypothetical protein
MLFNLIIRAKHETGAYATMGESQLRTFLDEHNWVTKHTRTTYSYGSGVLAVCDSEDIEWAF